MPPMVMELETARLGSTAFAHSRRVSFLLQLERFLDANDSRR